MNESAVVVWLTQTYYYIPKSYLKHHKQK